MNEINNIDKMAHDIRNLEAILLCCENMQEKTLEILNRLRPRLNEYKTQLDGITSHDDICLKDCKDRKKFKKVSVLEERIKDLS